MDQSKTNLPHFHEVSKSDQMMPSMKHHVTGILNHGQKRSHVFTWSDIFSGDSNIMLNCLVHALQEAAELNGGHLQPTLYLQCDNCPKDNKNRFVIGFLASLVKKKIFKKVKLSFMMVGHTHEDVDQLFSCISRALDRRDALTVPELHDVVQNSYQPQPETTHLCATINYKDKLNNGTLEGVSAPHVFKIVAEKDEVILYYKDWPLESENYKRLDISDMATERIFKSETEVNPPKMGIIEQFCSQLTKFDNCESFTAKEKEWWKHYCEDVPRKINCILETTKASKLPKFKEPQSVHKSGVSKRMEQMLSSSNLRLRGQHK